MTDNKHHPSGDTSKAGWKRPVLRRALIFGLEGLVSGALIGLLTASSTLVFLGVCLLGMVGGALGGALLFRSE